MIDPDVMRRILQEYGTLAQTVRDAFQALVDVFSADWSHETPDHRHIMRRKIRRMTRR